MGRFSEALEKSFRRKVNKSVESHESQVMETEGLPVIKQVDRKNTGTDSRNLRFAMRPLLKTKRKDAPELISLNKPASYEAEQFRALKTGLLFSTDKKRPRTIMITSAVPDEGKSFVAANLAVSFAQSMDEHVLLLDCDLRLPTVHRVFGVPDNSPGLSDVLSGTIGVPEALYKTGIDKLTILPGGRVPGNPSELLSSIRMHNLLKEVESRYEDRYVIIDTPPPLLTAESVAISRLVDGVLIVVQHGKTPRREVKDMIELIGINKILGIVLNRYDLQLAKYYGYGKYGSYYGPNA